MTAKEHAKEKKNSKTTKIPFNGLRFNCLDVIILLTALRRIKHGRRWERERENRMNLICDIYLIILYAYLLFFELVLLIYFVQLLFYIFQYLVYPFVEMDLVLIENFYKQLNYFVDHV